MEESSKDQNKRTREIKGVICLALAVFLLLCLFSYSPHDPSFTRFVGDAASTHNLIGKFGSYTADSIIRLLGVASFLLPVALLALAFQYFLRPAFAIDISRVFGFIFFTLSLAGLAGALLKKGVVVYGEALRAGGLLGAGLVRLLLNYFNAAGTYIIVIVMLIISLYFIIEYSLVSVTEKVSRGAGGLAGKIRERLTALSSKFSSRPKVEIKLAPVLEEAEPAPKKAKPKKIEQTHFDFNKIKSDGKFLVPPLSLLEEAPQKDTRIKRDLLFGQFPHSGKKSWRISVWKRRSWKLCLVR